jgi:catalase
VPEPRKSGSKPATNKTGSMSQRRESTERAEAAVPPPSAEPILVPRGSKVPAQDSEFLTTSTGVRLHHTDDSLKAGSRGPTLMDDFHLREKIMHFDHERIPERVVHARGVGVHGIFESYGNATEFTSAGFLRPGVVTPVFTRSRRSSAPAVGRHRARRARLRGEVLHRRGELRPRRQQHPGLLHP